MRTDSSVKPRVETDATHPFWHRDQPTTRAFRVDPDHAGLRAAFPGSWRQLVEVKALLDCYAMVDSGMRHSESDSRDSVRLEFARRVAGLLWAVADIERRADRPGLAETVADTAELFAMYAATGEWKPFVIEPPASGQPWFYCGRLSTWSPRSTSDPLSLLIVVPDDARQQVLSRADLAFDTMHAAAAQALGGPAELADEKPDMHVGQLVLAGGESAFGHKNFAHFFPLETPGASVLGTDFTVVFDNVFQERVSQCSLPLLRKVLGQDSGLAEHSPTALVDSLLVWFRGHDLGHFWRRGARVEDTGVREELGPFLGMALEETYADCHGLLAAAELVDHTTLGVAFCAEQIRYLSRRESDFADSVAATLELGWLARRGITVPSASGAWVAEALPALAELVRVLHATLWEGDRSGLDEIYAAISAGREAAARFESDLDCYPTDLSYVFA
ncbi:hypothetical protein [Actinokineospora iranica]|uniref:Uncharacterized protein n=1 Tax=Actinokineospora iranica TaxID=1271860 RepID=A0A1G6JV87_9PSEU|nr:hypothetical protein [Actinokineospora iranica]SDC22623.1 hypothetical protein SAMN05216174_101576 [Actinokineospora iranica]